MYLLTYQHRQAKMEMDTEDDVALEGSVGPPSSTIQSVIAQECQPETGEKAFGGNEESMATL